MNQIFRVLLVIAALSYAFTGKLKAQELNQGLSFLQLKIDPSMKMNASTLSMAYSMYTESGNDELAKAKSDLKAKKLYFKSVKASSRASNDFSRSFKKISSPDWTMQKETIVATFSENEIRTYVVYDKNGRWVRTMAYLFPGKMPEAMAKEVGHAYPEYKINMAVKVTEFNTTFHIFYLESDNFLKHVLVTDNDIQNTLDIQKLK